jgi:hypothetical protein
MESGRVLTVDVFDEDTATAYLIERTGRAHDEADARKLATALGRLPLALSHAAAYCESGTSFGEYLGLLVELPTTELFKTSPDAFYEQTVASTWKASIEAATADASLAADVLEMAAHFAPDAIPKSLFDVLVDASTALGRKSLLDAFNALSHWSLATVEDSTLSVHRLLQKVVRDDAHARGDRRAVLRALVALRNEFPDDLVQPDDSRPSDQPLSSGSAVRAFAATLPGEQSPRATWERREQVLPHALAVGQTLAGLPEQVAGPRPRSPRDAQRARPPRGRLPVGRPHARRDRA